MSFPGTVVPPTSNLKPIAADTASSSRQRLEKSISNAKQPNDRRSQSSNFEKLGDLDSNTFSERDDAQPSPLLTTMDHKSGNASKINIKTSYKVPFTSVKDGGAFSHIKEAILSENSSEEGEISDGSADSETGTLRLNFNAGDDYFKSPKGIRDKSVQSSSISLNKCDISPQHKYESRFQNRNKKEVIRKLFHGQAFEDIENTESDAIRSTSIGKENIQLQEPLICKIPLSTLRRVPEEEPPALAITIQNADKAIDFEIVSSKCCEPYPLRSRVNSGGKCTGGNNGESKVQTLVGQIADEIAKNETHLSNESLDDEESDVYDDALLSNTRDFVSDADTQAFSKGESREKLDTEVVQSADSSSNPPFVPSPSPALQPVNFSYFDKHNHEEEFSERDQKLYMEEAKRLKHRADNERKNIVRASVYLESGLYFILTGISLEKGEPLGSIASYNMYKDTLHLIRYIGNRFRDKPPENLDAADITIIILSMRCQALLFLKLFKMKHHEAKVMGNYLREDFVKIPPSEDPLNPIASSLQIQLESPSICTPTTSPDCSSVSQCTPSSTDTSVSRSLCVHMTKQWNHTMNLVNAHEVWDAADDLVERYQVKEFFIAIDRRNGPLTLHTTLTDLVQYVKQGLLALKDTSKIV